MSPIILNDAYGDKIEIDYHNYQREVLVSFEDEDDSVVLVFDQYHLITLIQQLTTALYSMNPPRRYHDDIRSKKENEAGL